jgi:hypothetical protein
MHISLCTLALKHSEDERGRSAGSSVRRKQVDEIYFHGSTFYPDLRDALIGMGLTQSLSGSGFSYLKDQGTVDPCRRLGQSFE